MVEQNTKTIEKTSTPELFKEANRRLYGIVAEVDEAYEEAGKDPERVSRGTYWLAVANHAKHVVQEEYSTYDKLAAGKALELAAMTPTYFIANQTLRRAEVQKESDSHPPEITDQCRYLLSRFNSLITDYVLANPSAKATELNNSLVESLRKTLEVPEQASQRLLTTTIAGIQHELAGGEILAEIGEVRPGSVKEDLRGIDFVLQSEADPSLGYPVDFKASRSTVGHKTGGDKDSEWGIRYGTLVTHSLVSHEELHDGFHAPEELIPSRARRMQEIVQEAQQSNQLRTVRF